MSTRIQFFNEQLHDDADSVMDEHAGITYAITMAHDEPVLFTSIATEVIRQGNDPEFADHLATALAQPMDRKTLLTKFASAGLLAVMGFRLAQRQAAAWSFNPATYTTPIAFQCYPVTQWFGPNTYSHQTGENAYAIDIGCRAGTPVYAPKSGIVVAEGWENYGGIVCRIRHDDGVQSILAHLNETVVNVGQSVRGGYTLIGKSGTTGGAPPHYGGVAQHLHWAAKVHGTSQGINLSKVPGVSSSRICP